MRPPGDGEARPLGTRAGTHGKQQQRQERGPGTGVLHSLPLNSRRVKREPLAGDAPMVLAACALDELRRFRPLDAPERILHQKALAQAEQVYRDARTLALYLAWLNAHVTGAAYREGAGA